VAVTGIKKLVDRVPDAEIEDFTDAFARRDRAAAPEPRLTSA
jgi:hypothetical protein